MEVCLKRIKRTAFDEFLGKVTEQFEQSKTIVVADSELEDISEEIIIKDKAIRFEYDLDGYLEIVNSSMQTYEKLTQIGMKLHKESRDVDGVSVPMAIMYEKEVWTYLTFKVFFDVVKKLRLEDDEKTNDDKIERFYFNVGNKRSRTGLLFVWSMIDALDAAEDEKVAKTAFHFIDPVKAIYERAMARNPIVLKAFVDAIIKCNCDARIKNKKYKTKVPNNISCFARVSMVDAYEYDELVETMVAQIKGVLATV